MSQRSGCLASTGWRTADVCVSQRGQSERLRHFWITLKVAQCCCWCIFGVRGWGWGGWARVVSDGLWGAATTETEATGRCRAALFLSLLDSLTHSIRLVGLFICRDQMFCVSCLSLIFSLLSTALSILSAFPPFFLPLDSPHLCSTVLSLCLCLSS